MRILVNGKPVRVFADRTSVGVRLTLHTGDEVTVDLSEDPEPGTLRIDMENLSPLAAGYVVNLLRTSNGGSK